MLLNRLLMPCLLTCALLAPSARAQTTEPVAPESALPAADDKTNPNDAALKSTEEQLAARYRRFEEVLLRMAELTAGEDPERAGLLRQAVAKSKKRLIAVQFDRLVDLLGKDRLSVAVTNQSDLMQDLKGLMELLLNEDRAERLESEQARLRAYLKEVNKLIQEQHAVQGQTRGAQTDEQKVGERQGKLADRTGKLADNMKQDADKARAAEAGNEQDKSKSEDDKDKPPSEQADKPPGDSPDKKEPGGDENRSDKPAESPPPSEGKQPGEPSPQPGDSQKPSDQAPQQGEPGSQSPEQAPDEQKNAPQQRVEQARERMREAQQKLEQANREQAIDRQRAALEELEQAKAELEKILRQLREEELARVLAMLETRFQKMLVAQKEILDGTVRLAARPETAGDRGAEIESGRLSRKQAANATEADKALTLLRDDGTAVAMPEAVVEIRDDMRSVAERLAQFKAEAITIGIEEDIVTALEEIVAALEQAQRELDEKKNQPQPPEPGEPQEPPLVDSLAELKMIRALQMRVNRRTQAFSQLIDGEQALRPELLSALAELAQRQERIERSTRDIAIGKNR